MEMAASALVAAVGRDGVEGERDSDSWSEEDGECMIVLLCAVVCHKCSVSMGTTGFDRSRNETSQILFFG